MKWTLISLMGLLVVVMGIALWRGTDTFALGLKASATQFVRFLPILLVAITLAGFSEVLLPRQVVEN